jgi:GH43 family beta-xylosidase
LWSGRDPEATRNAQNIYIAPMSDPVTISSPRVRLSTPEYPWERVGWPVNEGPEVLYRNGKTHIVYSASGGTTPDYALGLLTNPPATC